MIIISTNIYTHRENMIIIWKGKDDPVTMMLQLITFQSRSSHHPLVLNSVRTSLLNDSNVGFVMTFSNISYGFPTLTWAQMR